MRHEHAREPADDAAARGGLDGHRRGRDLAIEPRAGAAEHPGERDRDLAGPFGALGSEVGKVAIGRRVLEEQLQRQGPRGEIGVFLQVDAREHLDERPAHADILGLHVRRSTDREHLVLLDGFGDHPAGSDALLEGRAAFEDVDDCGA